MSQQDRPRYSNDERLTEAQREQYDAAADDLQHRGQGTGGGGGAGAAGAVVAPIIILGSILVFMLYACFYPVGAIVALLTGVVVSKIFGALVPGVGWMGHFLVLLPLAFSALMLFQQRVEWRLEQRRGYLLARHILRLCFTFVIVGSSLTFFTHTEELRARQPVEESYSWAHFAIVMAAVALVHFVGLWHDRRLVQVVPAAGPEGWQSAATGSSRRRLRMPGLQSVPGPLGRGLPLMTLVGGLLGAFLGYAGFETLTSTLVGLCAGCIGGALLMSACWLVTRPIGGLFDRAPVLWPLLMGATIGLALAWRLALADQKVLAAYALPGAVGGALALTVPYLIYALVRRL
jgi:hypothetical protein